jgi:putative transposase
MAMRKIIFAEGELYHVYNRGVDKRIVFTTRGEYERFLMYLHILNTNSDVRPTEVMERKSKEEIFNTPRKDPLVAIGAFCLMPNHFHLLLTPLVPGGVSKFMQKVQTAYTMYINARYERTGALFQGTFKAEHAASDTYAKYLYSYIHLNPSKLVSIKWKDFKENDFSKVRSFLTEYPHSSLKEYMSGQHVISDPSYFPEYFSTKKDLQTHIDDWIILKREV